MFASQFGMSGVRSALPIFAVFQSETPHSEEWLVDDYTVEGSSHRCATFSSSRVGARKPLLIYEVAS